MKKGSPLRVERRRQGVSIGCGKLPNWTTPALALPLLHAFTANFMLSLCVLYLRETTKAFSFWGKAVEEKRWVLLLKSNPLFCSVLFCLFETLNRLLTLQVPKAATNNFGWAEYKPNIAFDFPTFGLSTRIIINKRVNSVTYLEIWGKAIRVNTF